MIEVVENLRTLLVVLKSGQQLQLRFTTEARAKKALSEIAGSMNPSRREDLSVEAEDDFGSRLFVISGAVAAVLLVDVARDLKGAQELAMLQARAQAALQREAQADPRLRVLAANAAPPGLLRS